MQYMLIPNFLSAREDYGQKAELFSVMEWLRGLGVFFVKQIKMPKYFLAKPDVLKISFKCSCDSLLKRSLLILRWNY